MKILALLSLRAYTRILPMLGAATALLFLSVPAHADDNPFDLESSSWMSFDRYKEKPANWLDPGKRAEAVAQPVIIAPPTLPANMPKPTEPTRLVMTPPLPGVNKDFDIKVDSTADDHRLSITQPENPAESPTVSLPDDWKTAADAARESKYALPNADDSTAGTFNVRYSALPPWIIEKEKKAPAMTPAPASTLPPVKIAQPIAPTLPPAPPPPAVSTVDAAACAALDAYKKHQLQAIQSDRETLAALQNAIAQLGLKKQLDFMPGAGGSLNAEAAGGVTVPVANSATKN